jgi:hypothetical protein
MMPAAPQARPTVGDSHDLSIGKRFRASGRTYIVVDVRPKLGTVLVKDLITDEFHTLSGKP